MPRGLEPAPHHVVIDAELPEPVPVGIVSQPVLPAAALESPLSAIQTAAPPSRRDRWAEHGRWAARWGLRVAEFGAVQGVVQLLGAVAGLIVVRTLAKDQYALYAIAFQMQTTCNLLADLGIGIGVRSIGGRVWNDRTRFGSLINTALELRRWFAGFSLAACLPLAVWMLRTNGADWLTTLGLCAVLVAGVLPLLTFNVLAVVPQLHGEYRRIQRRDLATAAARLAMIAALGGTRITATLASAVGAVGNWLQLKLTRPWSHEHADPAAAVNADDRAELVRLSKRQFPNTLFFCFQGQVTLLILSWFGNSTGVADITALGRLGMLLTAFSLVFTNVLVPQFGRTSDPTRLTQRYCWISSLAFFALLPVALLSWLYPGPLLWILGTQYGELESECGWVVSTACLSVLVSVLWQLNSSRAWVYLSSIAWIPLMLLLQSTLAISLDLSKFHDLLIFNAISTAGPIPLFIYDAWSGIVHARKEGER